MQTKKQMSTKSGVKAGAFTSNHNQSGMAVKSKARAGALAMNHDQAAN